MQIHAYSKGAESQFTYGPLEDVQFKPRTMEVDVRTCNGIAIDGYLRWDDEKECWIRYDDQSEWVAFWVEHD